MDLTAAAPDLRYPLKIVSDLHYRNFSGRLQTPAQLQAVFAGFATVILNGDSTEQLLFGTVAARNDREEMEHAGASVGTRLIFLRGNHDPENGLPELVFRHRHRTVRITHGDFGVPPLAVSPHGARRNPARYLWHIARTFPTHTLYWTQVDQAFRTARDGEILVLGHTHRPAVHRREQKVIVNLGAHMRGFRNSWVEISDSDSEVVYHDGRPTFL